MKTKQYTQLIYTFTYYKKKKEEEEEAFGHDNDNKESELHKNKIILNCNNKSLKVKTIKQSFFLKGFFLIVN